MAKRKPIPGTRGMKAKFRYNVGPAQPASGARHVRRRGRAVADVTYYMGDIKTQTGLLNEAVEAANGAAMAVAVKQGLNPMHVPLIDKAQAVRKMIQRVARFYGVHGKYASAKTQLWLAEMKPKKVRPNAK